MTQKCANVLFNLYTAITAVIAVLIFLSPPALAHDRDPELEERVDKATPILAYRGGHSGIIHGCTATFFYQDRRVYRLLSDSHCVADDRSDSVKIRPRQFFITFDDSRVLKYIPVKVVAAGHQLKRDDCAILEVEIRDMEGYAPPIIPLATDDVEKGEPLINVANIHDLGKQLFHGSVSRPKIDRPLIFPDEAINWQGAMLLQMPLGPSSSGSVVVSTEKKAIVAIMVGSSYGNTVAIPIKWCQKFWTQVQAGKYKWFKPEEIPEQENE